MATIPFPNLNEYYDEVKSLSVGLKDAGYIDEGKQIHHYAFKSPWTTGSELLAELQTLFGELERRVSGELRERVRSCEHFAANHRKILGLD
jgi:hypothetical protein